MARFLAHMGRRGLIPSGQRRFGVDRVGLDAFAQAFALEEAEYGLALPFMIGVEALIRVESKALSRARIRHSAAFYDALLEELRSVAHRRAAHRSPAARERPVPVAPAQTGPTFFTVRPYNLNPSLPP